MRILIMSVVKKVISYVRGSVKVKHKPPSLPNSFDLCSLFKIATALPPRHFKRAGSEKAHFKNITWMSLNFLESAEKNGKLQLMRV